MREADPFPPLESVVLDQNVLRGEGWAGILGYMMFKSGLVPRRMAMLELIGGPLLCLAGILVIYDVIEASGPIQGLMTIPEAAWELSLGTASPASRHGVGHT